MKFVLGWQSGWEPPERLCSLGGSMSSGSSQSTGNSQQSSYTLPLNLANPSAQALAPQTSQGLSTIGLGGGTGSPQGLQTMDPTLAEGQSTAGPNNPLVAPVTAAQNQTLGGIGSLVNGLPSSLSSAFSSLNNEMQPGYAASLATSPQTKAAISSALQPITNTFQTQTVPGLQGSFTQAGQRVGSASPTGGSSAFDTAFANAQGGEIANEAATAGQIANNAYQTGVNISANAPGQMAALSSSELGSMISGLSAQALPQLTQQYGISAGTQLYTQQMSTILQALGLQVQSEQPSIGYRSTSQGTSTSQSSGQNSSFGLSVANPFSSFPV